jgi:alpha-L-rhamnosidase
MESSNLDVEIPANTKATVYIPSNSAESVMESNVALSSAKDIKLTGKEGNYVVVEVGSGKYHFTSAIN